MVVVVVVVVLGRRVVSRDQRPTVVGRCQRTTFVVLLDDFRGGSPKSRLRHGWVILCVRYGKWGSGVFWVVVAVMNK